MAVRLKILSSFILLVFTILIVRLFYWQIIKARDLSRQAKDQYESAKNVQASRGNILAKDKTWLVARGESYLMYLEPPKIKESIKSIANKIAPFFVENPDDKSLLLTEVERIETLLGKKKLLWIPIKERINSDTKNNIQALGIDGLGFDLTESRIYPEASAAAQLLGFVGKKEDGENIGYFGLEGYYNLSLQGKSGFIEQEKDARGNPINIDDAKSVSAMGGIDLLTHIDKTIQLTVEKKLKEGIDKYSAKGGTVIVMNPKDGSVMAMSSFPSYELGKYWEYGDEYFKNPAISFSFEPGSVFKVVVMAAALDSGVVKPDTICDICSGPFKVDKYFIETWNKKYNPNLTMTEVIVHSDNVGMSFVSQKLGSEKMYDYLDKFGIGKLTEIDLQGEIAPKLREKGTWNIVDLATASFGQGVALTPIELIKAVSTIANLGVEVTPQVVDKLVGENWEHDIKPIIGKRVISEDAAKDMTAMMVEAAKSGESKWTFLRGFKVAGKTGTAQIPISGHYDAEKTIASFIGFAPSDDAKFVMLVILNEPKSSQWASETAAPLWYSIAKELFSYLKIQPES